MRVIGVPALASCRVGVSEGVVEAIGVAVVALGVVGQLHDRVGAEETVFSFFEKSI